VAIEQALTILSWFENMQKDEVPPEHLWEDVEGLEQWWKDVEAKRNDGSPIKRTRGSSDDDDEPGSEMVENDYARYLKK
jgi:hypothetical protein